MLPVAVLSQNARRILRWVGVALGSMLAVGLVVNALYPSAWRPIEATVAASRIESVRYGNLQWALMVDAAYEVAGHRYETTKDVFHHTDHAVVATEAESWQPGRKFTLFYDAGNPGSSALEADGGREATVATAVLLTPLALMLASFAVFILRGRLGRTSRAPVSPTDA